MDEPTARDYLNEGVTFIDTEAAAWDRRENYYRGDQDLPFAPEGVNAEYLALRQMALANWLGLAMDAPVQRLRADGFRTGRDGAADLAAWNEVWQPNRLDARQRIVYTQMVVHGRGIMSVWPNQAEPRYPVIRPENSRRVHLEADPEDPFTVKWVVKKFTSGSRDVAMVYDATTWARFEKQAVGTLIVVGAARQWELVAGGTHPLGEPPFVAFDNRQDADAKPQSGIEPLMAAQDAINTVRFNTLLAMQFSAFRQRVFTGYDPVVRDAQGTPTFRTKADGTPLLDSDGLPVPVVRSPGRVGVDRALVFPGELTKVFDLPESNLSNYIEVLGEFLTQLFAVAQIPPQYLLSRMANLSADALTAAESTLSSLVSDLQRWCGESLEQVMRMANRARGEAQPDLASEVIWADAEARSFAQTVDAITKLVSVGFPREASFEMIPGATPQKVTRWMRLADSEALDPLMQQVLRDTATPPPVTPGAPGARVAS